MSAKNAETVAIGMGVDVAPRIHLTAKDLPSIKNWKVGGTYTVTMKLKQTSMQEGGWDGKQPMSADFKVVSVNGKKPTSDGNNTEGDYDEDD